ncbi:MAG: FAD-dependent oxidoreductase, partial [Clostridia bacterium]|nr:FAD-dependent oxidoreductase [Clostridia bacterium]
MKQMGFYYDPSACIGCRACQMGCKEAHNLPSGDFFRRVSPVQVDGRWTFFSGACNHCRHPACVEVCPNGALYKAEDGTVQHDRTHCIGCGRCAHSCPYGAITLSSITGYAQKCDGCAARRAEGRNPICVDACPVRALQFGDLEELKAQYGSCGAELPFLPDPAMTCPSLLVNGTEPATEAAAPTLAETETAPLSDNSSHIVILGSGAAAVSAAKEICTRAPHAKITMISREQRLPYARPLLSKGLLRSFAINRYPIVDEDWMKAHVHYICAEISALDADAHTVTLADGRTVSYDKCIYALGMECFVPPIPGHDLLHVYTLRYDTDLTALRKAMMTAESAVVIGGGITGLELAWEMHKAGLSVTVLDMVDQLLGRILDAHTAANLRTAIEAKGIKVDTGVQIAPIEKDLVLLN